MEADRLEILIEAQAKSANRQLNLLINKLTKLSGILGTVGANSANINKLADALSGMSDISINVTKSFEGMSKSGKSMGGVFNKLTNMFGGIASGAGRMALSFTKAALGIRTASKHANSAGLSFRSLFRAIIPFYGIRSIFNWAKDAVQVSSDLTEIQNVVNVTFGNMTNKMEEFADTSIRDFGMSELSAKQFASRFQAMGTAMAVPVGKIQSAGKALRDMGVTYGETEESLADISINLTKLTADMASFYDRDQADIAKALESVYTGMTRPLRAYGLDLTQATVQEWALTHGIEANMATMTQAEKTLLRYQYVMYNTAAAQGDFARTQDTFANQMRILKQTVQQFAAVFGSAVIGAIKPAIAWLNQFMLHAINVAQTVVNALGAIFGWQLEITPGGVSGDDYEDYADGVEDIGGAGNDAAGGLGKAADAAKEFQESVMGFDELNKLSEAVSNIGGSGSGGSGSGGSGAGAGGGAVSAADIRLTPKEPLIKQYQSQIDSLYELGEYISKTLQKTLEGINWDEVYRKARNFGTGLASFLNGLIKPDLFATLGKTIAGAINTKLNAFFAFGEIFSFTNLGNSLQTGITSALDNIDWDLAAKTAQTWGTKLAQGLNAFLTPSMFTSVARAITNKLNNAITFLWNFGSAFNFDNLADCISTGINTAVENFNVEDLVSTLNLWALKVVGAITRAISNTNWRMLGVKVGYILRNIKWGEFLSGVGQLLGEAIQGVIDFAKGLLDPSGLGTPITNALDTISQAIERFGSAVDWDGLAKSVGALVEALAPAVAGFAQGLADFFSEMMQVGAGLLNTIAGVFQVIADAINSLPPGDVEAFGKGLGVVAGALLTINGLDKVTTIIGGVVTKMAGIVGIGANAGTVLNETSEAAGRSGGLFGKLKDNLVKYGTSVWDSLGVTAMLHETLKHMANIPEENAITFTTNALFNLGKEAGLTDDQLLKLSNTSTALSSSSGSLEDKIATLGSAFSEMGVSTDGLVISMGDFESLCGFANITAEEGTAILSSLGITIAETAENASGMGDALSDANNSVEDISKTFSLSSPEYDAFASALQQVAENAGWSEGRIEELQAELTNTNGAESARQAYEQFKETIANAGLKTDEFERIVREKMPGLFDEVSEGASDSATSMDGLAGSIKSITGESDAFQTVAKNKLAAAFGLIGTEAEGADTDASSFSQNFGKFALGAAGQALMMAVLGTGFAGIGTKANDAQTDVENFGTASSTILAGLGAEAKKAEDNGTNVGSGFALGITGSTYLIADAVKGMVEQVNGVAKMLGIQSPSKVMEGYGTNTILGFSEGMNSNLHLIETATSNIVTTIATAIDGMVGTINQKGVDLVTKFKDGMESVSLSGVVTTWWNGMDFSGLYSNLENAGKNAAGYMVRGMKSVYMPKLDYVISEWRSHSLGNGGISYTPVYRGYWYAHGGFPNSGELFVAGEAGPEMVGKMGQKNVVANNIQITQGIKQAVIDGMMDVYMATRSDNSNQSPIVVESTLKVNDEVLARAVERGTARRQTRFSTVGATV